MIASIIFGVSAIVASATAAAPEVVAGAAVTEAVVATTAAETAGIAAETAGLAATSGVEAGAGVAEAAGIGAEVSGVAVEGNSIAFGEAFEVGDTSFAAGRTAMMTAPFEAGWDATEASVLFGDMTGGAATSEATLSSELTALQTANLTGEAAEEATLTTGAMDATEAAQMTTWADSLGGMQVGASNVAYEGAADAFQAEYFGGQVAETAEAAGEGGAGESTAGAAAEGAGGWAGAVGVAISQLATNMFGTAVGAAIQGVVATAQGLGIVLATTISVGTSLTLAVSDGVYKFTKATLQGPKIVNMKQGVENIDNQQVKTWRDFTKDDDNQEMRAAEMALAERNNIPIAAARLVYKQYVTKWNASLAMRGVSPMTYKEVVLLHSRTQKGYEAMQNELKETIVLDNKYGLDKPLDIGVTPISGPTVTPMSLPDDSILTAIPTKDVITASDDVEDVSPDVASAGGQASAS
tara:strand:- start:47 stop:1447 length:1401 start_codon:yes stop_codon:yes gene_type:complete